MDWQQLRREFPITEKLTHLNSAGVSPISRRVAVAVQRFVQEALVSDEATQRGWEDRTEEIRAAVARLIGAQSTEVAFVKNTSEGLSLVAAGLEWQPGDNVVAIDGEYPSNVYPWFGLRRWDVETRLAPTRRGRAHVDDIRHCIDARTRVVSVSFVDWSSGARTDLAALGALCRAQGILFCVDGIQGVGALQLDVEASGIDCLAVGGHKWLLGPEGCGFLYVAQRALERVSSVLHGWKSVVDTETYLPYHFDPARSDAARFEPGSPSHLSTHALGAAVDLLLEIGPSVIESRLFELTDRLAEALRRQGAEIISPWENDARSGIVVFRGAGDPQGMANALDQRGFVVRVRGGGIRVAPHIYTSENDIDRFVMAVASKVRRDS